MGVYPTIMFSPEFNLSLYPFIIVFFKANLYHFIFLNFMTLSLSYILKEKISCFLCSYFESFTGSFHFIISTEKDILVISCILSLLLL